MSNSVVLCRSIPVLRFSTKLLKLSVLSATLFLSTVSHAWHDLGHMLVAKLAYDQISANDSKLAGILDNLTKASCDYFSGLGLESDQCATFVQAATLLDSYSGKYPESKSWHYINMPVVFDEASSKVNYTAVTEAAAELPNVDIQLQYSLQVLRNNRADILEGHIDDETSKAFITVIHLMGDIHQPLHNFELFSDVFPNGDAGGNRLDVKGVDGVSNLHSLWDSMADKYSDVRWYDSDALDQVAKFKEEVSQAVAAGYSAPFNDLRVMVDPWNITSAINLEMQHRVYDDMYSGVTVSDSQKNQIQLDATYLVAMAGEKLARSLQEVLGSSQRRVRQISRPVAREAFDSAFQRQLKHWFSRNMPQVSTGN
ncbi:hypothetical protein EOPP23_12815 [Endozoicomonas sp. OPT23]|uniref:S1/P1 nuclease n=1 Tax=Endozoicomonas sp. OPT23 TaxID=2072845 RepID=UPI00129A1B48|nr:S1/P1 nuclease [Endozoicomonas sp. OPT23]MRI33869.1 hypothetical protein [Endozoicomonas sp. OPT23]